MKFKNTTRKGIVFGNWSVAPNEVIELDVKTINSDGYAMQLFERLVPVDSRSSRSKALDVKKTSLKLLDYTPENVKKWLGKPNEYDLKGVDA